MTDSFNARAFLSTLTTCPGVYQMMDDHRQVIYVGKARNLKKRVSSYFRSYQPDAKNAALTQKIAHIEIIITNTENEALLLESNLIKKFKPSFNVLLRDDKSYPYLHLSDHKDFPRLDFYRGTKQLKGRYFGPYPSATAVRESLALLQKLFRLRQCNDNFFKSRIRPCLQYQIKRCTAPCVGYIDPKTYQQNVKHAVLFLEGKNQQVIDALIRRMEQASALLEFERAGQYRDQIAKLRHLQQRQYVSKEGGDVDVIAIINRDSQTCVEVLYIRGGQLIGNKAYFPLVPEHSEVEEIFSAFISQYYLSSELGREIPRQIVIDCALSDRVWLEKALSEQCKKRVNLLQPQRGIRLRWLRMARQNAHQALVNHLASKASTYRRLEALQEALTLENIPQRLECFDVSHTHGEATVASCVVFDSNGPAKNEYRRFNIKEITPGDDYAALRQALLRRYTRLKETDQPLPDILFIDGGKGQLHQAEKVLEELQVTGIVLIGIAKGPGRKPGLETLFIAGKLTPLSLPFDSEALHLIQQIRDEAHRFAITGHRQQRAKARVTSVLQQIPGIGPKRRRELLQRFGGLQEVMNASTEDIAKIPGISHSLAKRIYDTLHGQ